MKSPREKAETLAKEIVYVRMPGLEQRIADTLEPLLEEIEAARSMRDALAQAGFTLNLKMNDERWKSVSEYDEIRKRNEGK